MASLSNINGIFDVHSTGAIQFNGNHGTAGQILKSNGNAAPTWVAASTVIGGPYLPLTGGTLSGATATATGINFTVGGTLTGTSATFSGNVTGPRFIGTSDRTEAVDSNDTRNTNPDPEDIDKGIYFDFKANSANGLSDGGGYNGMMLWRSYGGGSDLSGGQPIRLAYTANGNLWRQMGTGATSWGSWNKFAICTGTSSQYIRGDGSIATFPTISTGTVTSVATGTGLTGGTITTTGTLSIDSTVATLAGQQVFTGNKYFNNFFLEFNSKTLANFNDLNNNQFDVSMYDVYNLAVASTGMLSTYGTLFQVNGRSSHTKTQFAFNGGNDNLQYRTSWYPNTAWTSFRQIWDSDNLPNPTQGGPYLPLTGGTVTGLTNLLAGSKIVVQNGVNGGNARGIFMWTNTDANWGIYMATSGSTQNIAGGSAPSGLNGESSHCIRFRIASSATNGFIWENSANATLMSMNGNSGNLTTSASMRSPIFYDSNNTGYYVDPASQSSMYGVAVRGDLSNTATGNQIFFWGGGNSTTSAIGFKANGGDFVNPTGNGDGYNTYLTMDTNGRGWVFRRGTGGSNFTSAFNSGWILNDGNWQANTSMRAPIFYDSNNTTYFLNPSASGGNSLKTIGDWRQTTDGWSGEVGGKMQYHGSNWYIQATNSFIYRNAGGSNRFTVDNGGIGYIQDYLTGANSLRAPIFYDSNNTAYYGDFASTSNLNALQFNYTQHGSANNIRMGNSTTMNAISSGTNNAAFGVEALGGCSTGSRNFAYGYASLFSLSSGGSNIAMGDATGYNVTSGSNNLLFGQNAGRTGYQSPYQSIAGVTSGSNQIHMGNESHSTARIQISWTVNSDSRDKTDVTPIDVGLDFVKDLNPVTFRWDKRSDYEDRIPTGKNKLEELTLGFLAQEVEEVEKSYGYDVANKTNLVVDRDVDQDHFGITYEKMIPILTKAIQEQQVIIDDLKLRIEKLEL